SSNSALSSDGLKRAQDLKDTLTSRKIDLIYVSTFLRTQQTAQATATAKGLSLNIYSPDITAGFIARLKKMKRKKLLVVGHSDTVPDILQGLSQQSVAPIPGNDFDNLYIITVRHFFGARRSLSHITYGRPSP
ncbi:MAG: histidine phosphatase family protein, partial [Ginsengibacter sp.]